MFSEILEKLTEISSKLDQLGSPISWIIPFLSGAFVVILAEVAKHILFKPKLNLEFDEGKGCIADTWEINRNGQKTADARYIRVKVTNNSRIIAKDCRGYLINIEKQNKHGKFAPTVYCDSIQLAWSCQGKRNRYEAVDISKGVNQYLDVITTRNTSREFDPQIMAKPLRYLDLFKETGIFRLIIQASVAGADPKIIKLIFNWKGVWNDFSAKKG